MSQLAVASFNPVSGPSVRWAHDIRNVLSTIGLHLERLERLSGPRGHEIAYAAHQLMSRAAAMCTDAMAQPDAPAKRRGFDIVAMLEQVADLLRPAAPGGFEIRIAAAGAVTVLANRQDVFRILFNLLHNATMIAREADEGRPRITMVTMLVERDGTAVTVRIADDGPGLPEIVRRNLFRPQALSAGGGMGLSIARELAERNGGVLRLLETQHGTTFALQLAAPDRATVEPAALRSLGKSVRHESLRRPAAAVA